MSRKLRLMQDREAGNTGRLRISAQCLNAHLYVLSEPFSYLKQLRKYLLTYITYYMAIKKQKSLFCTRIAIISLGRLTYDLFPFADCAVNLEWVVNPEPNTQYPKSSSYYTSATSNVFQSIFGRSYGICLMTISTYLLLCGYKLLTLPDTYRYLKIPIDTYRYL